MKLSIASIHVNHKNGLYWRNLQSKFISKYTRNYSYGVFVNGGSDDRYNNVIYHTKKRYPHLKCINLIIDYFKNSDCDRFLILDSDCWPIKENWNIILDNLLDNNYLYAAPMRVENFDNFPHPCAFYMKREALDIVDFDFHRINNFLGIDISDVGTAMPTILGDKQIWHPLIKTNYISPHPVYASIYGDLFYHHCAGSRGIGYRSSQYKFYKHTIINQRSNTEIYNELTDKLFSSPFQYISLLRGKGINRII